jgi:signal peptidase I
MSTDTASVKGPRIGALTASLCVAVLVSVLGIVGWDLSGGRLVAMSTPSMCPIVCVGSLVAIQPQSGLVHAGELVTFRPPGQSEVFTHRVEKVEANGSFTTKADAETSPDPWVITPSDVIGRVSFTLFGLGWWLRALPMVAIGTLLLLLARRAIRRRSRRSFERLFGTMIAVLPIFILHPLVSGELVESIPDPRHHGWVRGLVVNTGLLPTQFRVVGGQVLGHLAPSQLHWLVGPSGAGRTFGIHQFVSIPTWGWGVALLIILSPILGFLAYRLTTPVEVEETANEVEPRIEATAGILPNAAHGGETIPLPSTEIRAQEAGLHTAR